MRGGRRPKGSGMKTKYGVLPMLLAACVAVMPPVMAQESVGTVPAPGSAHGPRVDPAEMAADALVVRPVALASTVVGAAIFLVALPFAAIAGDVKSTGDVLVGAPARYTFKRRLGDFESHK